MSKESLVQQITSFTDHQGKATPRHTFIGGYDKDGASKQLSFGKQGRGTSAPAEEVRPQQQAETSKKKRVRKDVVTHMDSRTGLNWYESESFSASSQGERPI